MEDFLMNPLDFTSLRKVVRKFREVVRRSANPRVAIDFNNSLWDIVSLVHGICLVDRHAGGGEIVVSIKVHRQVVNLITLGSIQNI
jgi:hypothetical protein